MSMLDVLYSINGDICTAVINVLGAYIEYSQSMHHEKISSVTAHVSSESK